MKYINYTIEMFVWSVVFGALYVHPVSAYLDPGGGSLLIPGLWHEMWALGSQRVEFYSTPLIPKHFDRDSF